MTKMTKQVAKMIKLIIAMFANLNGSSFVGIKNYVSSSTGEVSNHVVIANFNYGNAVEKDLKALQSATLKDIEAIVTSTGFPYELVIQAIKKLTDSFIKNMNPETKSVQSKAQAEAYINITNSIRYGIATQQLYIYALSVSKQVLVKGEYKTVNSSPLTLCQNAVKKYFDFSTSKFRNFVVSPDQLSGVNIAGEKIVLQ